MDIYCPMCGEPWDMDCLHDEAQARYGVPYYEGQQPGEYVAPLSRPQNPAYDSDAYQDIYKSVRDEFQTKGCGVALSREFTSGTPCKRPESESGRDRAALAAAAYDLLGDDLDGAASMLDDWL